jgi:alkylation response protein AidB-like acyl-CoA dehydrogenase
VAVVIVPADRTGVRLIDDWDGFGQRRTGNGTTLFTDVAVSDEEVLSDSRYDAEPAPDSGGVRDPDLAAATSE